jgi:magnesium transporter
LQRRIQARPAQYEDGWTIFTSIMDQRIDLDADIIELLDKETTQFSKRINQKEDINEDFLLDINQLQENAMMVRENIVDKQRMISSVLKSEKTPDEINDKLSGLLKDITSLINHTDFNFERLEYLQNTVLGLINLEQNKIMKVFTLVSLLLMPPTLVASIYGMNVQLPLWGGMWDFFMIMLIMLLLVVIVLSIFRRRKML